MRVCRLALRCIGARAGFVSVREFVGACACWVLGDCRGFVSVLYHALPWAIVSKIKHLAGFYHALYHAWIMYRIISKIMTDNAGLSQN